MTLKELQQKSIKESSTDKLTEEEINSLTEFLEDWEIDQDGTLTTSFELDNFKDAIKIVNSIADLAEEEQHHPDILIHNYKFVMLSLYTHDIEGLTEKDFIFAAKVEKLLEDKE
jgi:4a-hydroxytetrahydrobiopterin dehydratase